MPKACKLVLNCEINTRVCIHGWKLKYIQLLPLLVLSSLFIWLKKSVISCSYDLQVYACGFKFHNLS